ncbi:MAG: Rieske (2Fe-2S) region [Fibrobacteria bacterium]|jgi:nitrite reductase/ring-hydroxylating ferredoxin subunit|nr:Rieske (2Fe-2S) region [Fibrobacteria bacterium]
MRLRVPDVLSLQQGETRVFQYPTAYGDMQGFVIRHNGELRAYENKCRHWPIPLDYGDGDFYFASADRIVCKTHGAMYDPATGECDSGPCAGQSLTAFPLELTGEDAWVEVPEP